MSLVASVQKPVVPPQALVAANVDSADVSTALHNLQTAPPSMEEVPLADTESERLIELAKQRERVVKDYLIETGELDPERLFVCYSDVEKDVRGPLSRADPPI